jgi:2-polyprenyl-6-methoxyphenol hydroxylase-like FAD-dependent oxidoreductase
MNKDSTDVVVIGAGPAGLTLANYLLLQGISARVLDRAPGPPVRESSFLHCRGSEVLERLGALGTLREESFPVTRTTAYMGQQALRCNYVRPGEDNPFLPMVISQTKIEKALRDRMADLGGTVEWDSGLVDIDQDATGVTAVLSNGERVRASWLVGCDGAESMVRKVAGIGFPGSSDRYLLLDAHVDWDLDRDGLTGWLHPDGRVGAMPMIDPEGRSDLWRILARDPSEGTDKPSDEEIVSRVKTVLAERTRYGAAQLRDTTTKVVFTAHSRVADSYRKGRVLLAGDAAHAHVPFGGPAIHTGISDGENLAWKLALIIAGRADEALLATYEAERRPIATEILLGIRASARIDAMRNPVVLFTRDRVVAPLLNLSWVQRITTYSPDQLWETYYRGPLGRGSRFGPKPRPGDTLPNLECVRAADQRSTVLYDEIGARWALLIPARGADKSVSMARQWLGDDGFVVLGRTAGSAASPAARQARKAAGEVWLVRPDSHLAWRGQPDSPELGQWLEGALRHGNTR